MQRAVQDMEWIIEKASLYSIPTIIIIVLEHNTIHYSSMKRGEENSKGITIIMKSELQSVLASPCLFTNMVVPPVCQEKNAA